MRTHNRTMLRAGLTVLGAASVALAAAVPANAVDTTGTFVVTAGALTVTAPTTANLGTGAASTEIDASLGAVTVTDARGNLVATWTATASASAFTTGGGTPAETIPNSSVSYWSGAATSTAGEGVFTPGQLTRQVRVPLSVPVTALNVTSGVGSNAATWNPGIVISVPNSAVAGTYTGTITHSVA